MTKQHVKTRLACGTALALVICLAVTPEIVFASAGQVQAKLTNAANVVKGIFMLLFRRPWPNEIGDGDDKVDAKNKRPKL